MIQAHILIFVSGNWEFPVDHVDIRLKQTWRHCETLKVDL
jgi:hypothetical protein